MNERREYVMNGKPFCQIKKRNYTISECCVFFVRVVFFLMRVLYTLLVLNLYMPYVDDDDGIKLSTRHGLKDVEARNLKQFIITTIWVFLCIAV